LYCQDWPSRATFKGGKFAEIYEEFEDCLPFPHLTRLDGRDNLAAHFPDDAGLPPDLGNDRTATLCSMAKCGDVGLGPKVYFALAAKEDDGHHGSTRLHCDLTDAINVCVFAARQSDGSPGGARWHIFSPDDTMQLRKVLPAHDDHEDPVLAQNTYLSPSALHELELQHGIKAATFIQHEGDAVFIPAGCAHQVSRSLICVTIVEDIKDIGQQRHKRH
jgi:JmjC domain, hydroxylase